MTDFEDLYTQEQTLAPEVDFTTAPQPTMMTLSKRQPTNKIQVLLAFAAPALYDLINRLINSAQNEINHPRPTQEQITDLENALTNALRTMETQNRRIRDLEATIALGSSTTTDAVQILEDKIAITQQEFADYKLTTAFKTDRLTADITLNNATIADNVDNLRELNSELDAINDALHTEREQNEQLATLNRELTIRIEELEAITPQDSISNAGTTELTNPTATNEAMFIAAAAARLSARIPQDHVLETDELRNAVTMSQIFARIATIRSQADATRGQTSVERRLFTGSGGSDITDITNLGNQSVDHYRLLRRCFTTHNAVELAEIASQTHTKCRFGHGCFIAHANRNIDTTPIPLPAITFQLSFTDFIIHDLRPRRYPVSYANFCTLIYDRTTLRIANDIVRRHSD